MSVNIVKLASFLPQKVLTNHALEQMVDTSNEWIVSRSGISERRICQKDEHASTMGVKAAQRLLSEMQLSGEEIDAILVATMSPDYLCPSTATLIQHQLNAKRAFACDIQAACCGFLYGLSIARGWLASGMYRNVLLIATEKMSSVIDYTDRKTCVLFGDGACAAWLSSEEKGLSIDAIHLGSDGAHAEMITIPEGGSRHPIEHRGPFLKMDGQATYRQAICKMEESTKTCLNSISLGIEDIRWIVPHQANERILDAIAKRLSFSRDYVYKTLHKYGNTSASAIGIALDELLREEKVEKGEKVLLTAFGAGATWGSAVITKEQ